MKQLTRHLFATACATLLLTGCSVNQEQPAQAPDVDIDVDPGRWPEYDVNWADVDVGTEQRTITIPVVRVEREQRQVQVPYIRIAPPGGSQTEERTVSLNVDVPHAGYELQIVEVRASGDDLWVIGQLRQTGGASAQVLTRLQDHVVVQAPANLDVRKIVIGERQTGAANGEYTFLPSMEAVADRIPEGARTLYRRQST